MVHLDLKKLTAPDFAASIRHGTPALMVIDEAAVPARCMPTVRPLFAKVTEPVKGEERPREKPTILRSRRQKLMAPNAPWQHSGSPSD
jgi:hypothetical protein